MIAFFRECLCTCCLGWQEGMRDSWIFPYVVTVIRIYWYVMQQSGIEAGNNDTKSGILTTYGIIPCNSNPSSSAIRFTQDSPESWGFFFCSPLLKFGFFQIFRRGFSVSLWFSLTPLTDWIKASILLALSVFICSVT